MAGLIPARRLGSPTYGDLNTYEINPTNTTKIFQYDPVTLTSGFIVRSDGATTMCGVLMGVKYEDRTAPGGTRWLNHWNGVDPSTGNGVSAGTTRVFAEVADLTDLLFHVEATGTLARADFGGKFDVTLGSGNAFTGQSTATIDLDGSAGTLMRLMPLTIAPAPGDPGIGVAGTRTMLAMPLLHQFAVTNA